MLKSWPVNIFFGLDLSFDPALRLMGVQLPEVLVCPLFLAQEVWNVKTAHSKSNEVDLE